MRWPLARIPPAAYVIAGVLAGAAVLGVALLRATPNDPDSPESRTRILAGGSELDAPDVLDTDRDGLPDAQENYVYGTDPRAWDSGGHGIPDGWLVRHGFDPLDPSVSGRTAAVPDAASLPEAFHGTWPTEYEVRLVDSYRFHRPAAWDETRDGAWTGGLDPGRWDQDGDGVPDGYLLAHGLDPTKPGLAEEPAGDGTLTVRQKFAENLDPASSDTDRDGLDDEDEVRLHTDPRAFSTAGTGLADGWAVLWALDPLDEELGLRTAPNGLSFLETFQFSVQKLGPEVLRARSGLDPTKISTRGGPIPDGWFVRFGLDPLGENAADQVVARASDVGGHDEVVTSFNGVPPLPDLALTLHDAYAFQRPSEWSEERDGVWWGGLAPNTTDTDDDGLADVLELRGGYVTVVGDLGRDAQPLTYVATSNPLEPDTDLDGLLDGEELRRATGRPATDPSRPDTDFDGLNDADEVLGPLTFRGRLKIGSQDGTLRLDPTRVDSSGALLTDGAAFRHWEDRAELVNGSTAAYEYAGSRFTTHTDALAQLGAHAAGRTGPSLAALLRPEGDADQDGLPNLLDPDADDDGLLSGPELDSDLYRLDPNLASTQRRPGTDPANPDTDGDGLFDRWEVAEALFDGEADRWLLDPAKYDTFGDGTPDGERDPDEDSIRWSVYRADGGRYEREVREFVHDHLSEQKHGTKPFAPDGNQDGVVDGFSVFWGSVYPDLVVAANPLVLGARVPPPTVVEAEKARLGPESDLTRVVLDGHRLAYHRFVDVTAYAAGGTTDDVFDRAHALLAEDRSEEFSELLRDISVVGDRSLDEASVAEVQGTYAFSVAEADVFGTNPYMADSDGDALPDAWEAAWLRIHEATSHDGLDPAQYDAASDPGGRLTNLQKYALRTANAELDPLVADSDLAGIADATELDLGLQPANPEDDASVLSGDGDRDGDRVLDRDEFFDQTDPLSVDTDRDGLLDSMSDIALATATDATTINAWRALGVAHRVRSDGNVEFLSEHGKNGDPTTAFSSGSLVPDGWLAYYNKNPKSPVTAALEARYAFARPAWWDESAHGVWWWGRAGTDTTTGRDLDADGLDDLNGEDPVPAARHRDVVPAAPAGSDAWPQAQSYGDCPGDPRRCRDLAGGLDYDQDHARPDLLDRDDTELTVTAAPLHVQKEGTFPIGGTLKRDSDAAPLSGVAVLAALDGPRYDRLVGVAFTDANGAFTMTACACADRTVPGQPGVTLLGVRGGGARLRLDLAATALGPHTIHVWTLNTTTTYFGQRNAADDAQHPQWYNRSGDVFGARAASAEPLPVEVRATSRLLVGEALEPFVQGDPIKLRVLLQDQAGLPLTGTVSYRWPAGAAPRSASAEAGEAELEIPTSATSPRGPSIVALSYAGEPPRVTGSTLDVPVTLLAPAHLAGLSVPRGEWSQGETLLVTGRVEGKDGPVSGGIVTAKLGASEVAAPVLAGRFDAPPLTVPPGVVGDVDLDVEYLPGASAYTPDSATVALRVLAGIKLTWAPSEDHWIAGDDLVVSGRVRGHDGLPRAGSQVVFTLPHDRIQLGVAEADDEGLFALRFRVPDGLALGAHLLSGEVPADAATRGVTVAQLVFAGEAPRIQAVEIVPLSNGSLEVRGRLTLADGSPLGGLPVRILGTAPAVDAVDRTDATGEFSFRLAGPYAPGQRSFRLRFEGASEPPLAPIELRTTLAIRHPLTLDVPAGCLHRDGANLTGRLTAAGASTALLPLEFTAPGLRVVARTDGAGAFNLRLDFDRRLAPGPIEGRLVVPGGPLTEPLDRLIPLCLFADTSLAWDGDAVVPRGGNLTGRVTLRDEFGQSLNGRPVHIAIEGRLDLTETTRPEGASVDVPVPRSLPLGNWSLTIEYAGDAYTAPSLLQKDLEIRDAVRLQLLRAPASVEPGRVVDLLLRLTDADGNPLAARALSVVLPHGKTPRFVTTDAAGEVRVPVVAGEEIVTFRFAGDEALAPESLAWDPPLAGQKAATSWTPWIALGLVLPAAAGAVILARRWLLRRQAAPAPLETPAAGMSADGIDHGGVLLAYRKFVEAVSSRGYAPQSGESVRDFAARAAIHLPLDAVALEHLVRVTDRALYGRPPGPGARTQALRAWARLEHDLAAVAQKRPGGDP